MGCVIGNWPRTEPRTDRNALVLTCLASYMPGRLYVDTLPLLLLRVRFAREKWLRKLWRVLTVQWEIDSAVHLASVMTDKLFKKGSEPYSMIYLGFAMSTKAPYVGMVEARNPLTQSSPIKE